MFRTAEGYKARFQDLTLVVAADFDEWRILLQGPDLIIHGGRQFTGSKAKEHAEKMAEDYVRNRLGESLPDANNVEWEPLESGHWLNWRP